MANSGDGPGVVDELRGLVELIRDYAKQETIDPLKRLGRYLALGLAGAVLLSLGAIMMALAGLRALQDETGSTFTGSWTWAPYAIVVAGLAVVMGAAALALNRGGSR